MKTSCLFVQSKKHQAETPWQLSIAFAINTCLCTPVSPRQDSVRYKDGLVFPEPDDPSSLQHTSRLWPSCLASRTVLSSSLSLRSPGPALPLNHSPSVHTHSAQASCCPWEPALYSCRRGLECKLGTRRNSKAVVDHPLEPQTHAGPLRKILP